MSVPADIVSQSVFTAALFLTLISVPKITILTIWYTYRIAVYKYGKRLSNSMGTVIKQEAILKDLRKQLEDPVKMVNQTLKEVGNFTRDIRDATIEAVVALALMWFVYPIFPELSIWLVLSAFIIIGIIIWAYALIFLSLIDVNRLKVANGIDYEI